MGVISDTAIGWRYKSHHHISNEAPTVLKWGKVSFKLDLQKIWFTLLCRIKEKKLFSKCIFLLFVVVNFPFYPTKHFNCEDISSCLLGYIQETSTVEHLHDYTYMSPRNCFSSKRNPAKSENRASLNLQKSDQLTAKRKNLLTDYLNACQPLIDICEINLPIAAKTKGRPMPSLRFKMDSSGN